MKVYVSEDGYISLKDIYVPIVLVADKEKIVICERDGVFEINGRPLLPVVSCLSSPDCESYDAVRCHGDNPPCS